MKVDLEKYDLVSKISLGVDLRLIFKNQYDQNERKVLQLDNVAGFIDLINTKKLKWLRVDDSGSYSFDLSMRLKRPEIKDYKEVFLFTDSECNNFNFRAAAQQAEFRDWTEKDKWLK
ncbi:MAG TPA: hypothetical protein VIH57_18165 [Bacteroidales bacterium]